MSVHYLPLYSPTGSPIRSVVDEDGTAMCWPASDAQRRPLLMTLIDSTDEFPNIAPTTLIDADGRRWVHPVHRAVSLCNERPSTQVVWLSRRRRASA